MSAFRIRRLLPRFSLRTLVVFTLLVTSGVGLFARWWAWANILVMRGEVDKVVPRCLGYGMRVTYRHLQFEDPLLRRHVEVDAGLRCLIRRPMKAEVVSGDVVLLEWAAGGSMDATEPGSDATHCRLINERRSVAITFEDGWSIARYWERRAFRYLPCYLEFWLTVAFAGVFVWSVVRDRRALGGRLSPPGPGGEAGSGTDE